MPTTIPFKKLLLTLLTISPTTHISSPIRKRKNPGTSESKPTPQPVGARKKRISPTPIMINVATLYLPNLLTSLFISASSSLLNCMTSIPHLTTCCLGTLVTIFGAGSASMQKKSVGFRPSLKSGTRRIMTCTGSLLQSCNCYDIIDSDTVMGAWVDPTRAVPRGSFRTRIR